MKRRCLVVADGFFEWEKTKKQRLPFYIRLRSGLPFGLAGLYNIRPSSEGHTCSCTIITTGANELVRPIHDRMPVILPEDVEDAWPDPAAGSRERHLSLLRPYPAAGMDAYDATLVVNNAGHDAPDCIAPAPK